MTTAITKKGGKGTTDGVISELFTVWDILPGRQEEIRVATEQMADAVRNLDPATSAKTGLRDVRTVIINGGRQLVFATTFETEWDPYIDDAVLVAGATLFMAWLQHTVQGQDMVAWAKETGADKSAPGDPEWEARIRKSTSRIKEILQENQVPATAYFNAVSGLTLPQIDRAQRVERAFEQVLDDPDAAEALQQPALKPLLELAAD